MKIIVIDGQGGKLGAMLVARIKAEACDTELIAIGTNSIATAAMLRAGAAHGATGENPVIVNCRNADIIVGPIGIVVADSLLGEVTPAMAAAIGQSAAQKLLLPINRCNNYIIGVKDMNITELIDATVAQMLKVLKDE
jgi:hypothetical protein